MPRLHQMLGNLFYRGQSIDILERANYASLKYWNDWHKIMEKEEIKTANKLKSKSKT